LIARSHHEWSAPVVASLFKIDHSQNWARACPAVSSAFPNDQNADDKAQGRDTGQNVKNCRVESISHADERSSARPPPLPVTRWTPLYSAGMRAGLGGSRLEAHPGG